MTSSAITVGTRRSGRPSSSISATLNGGSGLTLSSGSLGRFSRSPSPYSRMLPTSHCRKLSSRNCATLGFPWHRRCAMRNSICRTGRILAITPRQWSRRGGDCLARLPRQVGLAHEEFVDGVRRLAAFADGPHHERLAAAHVAGGKHLRPRGAVVELVSLHVAALIEVELQVLNHALLHRMQEAHGEQNEIRRDAELAPRDRLHLPVEANAFELLDLAV